MRVLEALVLEGWLANVAPTVTNEPDAPLSRLSACAVAQLSPNYGGESVFLAAVSNCLRRASVTALTNACASKSLRIDLVAVSKQIMEAKVAFDRLLGRRMDLHIGLGDTLIALPGLRRAGKGVRKVVPQIVEAFVYQCVEVLPRQGPYAWEPTIATLEAVLSELEGDVARAAHRDLGSSYSLSGKSAKAKEHFVASGDSLREVVQQVDDLLANEDWSGAERLVRQALEGCDGQDLKRYEPTLLQRLAWAAGRSGDRGRAERFLLEAVRSARTHKILAQEVRSLEELSASAADSGDVDRAVTYLGAIRRCQRRAVNAAGEGRALRLAGRLLCENGRSTQGLVMLFQAQRFAGAADPHVEHPLAQYITGFQATLNRSEMDAVESALGRDWEAQIDDAFRSAAQRCESLLI